MPALSMPDNDQSDQLDPAQYRNIEDKIEDKEERIEVTHVKKAAIM